MRQDHLTGAGFLPGFEAFVATRDDVARMTDEQIDLRFPANTGANLKASNPRLYAIAARLFFEFGCSQREVAVLCQISRQTVAALVEAERPTVEARAQKTARLRRLRALEERSLSKLEGLMHDDVACRKAGPVAVAAIWRQLSEAADKLDAELQSEVVDAQPAHIDCNDKGEPLADSIKYLG